MEFFKDAGHLLLMDHSEIRACVRPGVQGAGGVKEVGGRLAMDLVSLLAIDREGVMLQVGDKRVHPAGP